MSAQSRTLYTDRNEFWGRRWALLAALLRAQPGDSIQLAAFRLPELPPRIVGLRRYTLDWDPSRGITVGSETLATFIRDINNQGSEYIQSTWRDTSPHYYVLFSTTDGIRTFVDGDTFSDIPDFMVLSASLPIPGLHYGAFGGSADFGIIWDRFGRFYLTFGMSGGFGIEGGFAGDGYVTGGNLVDLIAGRREIPSRVQVTDTLLAQCIGPHGMLVVGGLGASACLNRAGVMMYGAGLGLGAGAGAAVVSIPLAELPSFSWDRAIQDRLQGTVPDDLAGMREASYGRCP